MRESVRGEMFFERRHHHQMSEIPCGHRPSFSSLRSFIFVRRTYWPVLSLSLSFSFSRCCYRAARSKNNFSITRGDFPIVIHHHRKISISTKSSTA